MTGGPPVYHLRTLFLPPSHPSLPPVPSIHLGSKLLCSSISNFHSSDTTTNTNYPSIHPLHTIIHS